MDVTIHGKRPDITGLWMDLDRKQINDLIRSQRGARDSAYGADARSPPTCKQRQNWQAGG